MFVKLYWKLKFKLNGFTYYPYSGSGGSKTVVSPPPPPPALPTATETAADVFAAQQQFTRPAAELDFSIFTDPEIGIQPRTQAVEDARASVFPQEQAVREELLNNILANLISPQGQSQEQQASVESIRQRESERLRRGINIDSNIGGGLFGGRRQQRGDEAQTQLGQAFASEDISRDETNRLNAIQAALPALQILFPELNLVAPQFQSPVPTANVVSQGQLAGRGQDLSAGQFNANFLQNQQNQQNTLLSSLFQGLGTGLGGL